MESKTDNAKVTTAEVIDTGQLTTAIDGITMRDIGLSLIPFTPVPFTGKKSVLSYGRLALYGGLAIAAYPKSKRIAYALGGAALVSGATSLSANAWNKHNG